MPDTVSKVRRSEIMSHIKNKDTSIELLLRKRLHSLGYWFRVNYKGLPGKSDVVFTKKKLVIFVHGCFWHGHEIGCRYSHTSQSNKEYWQHKLEKTKQRDKEHIENLLKDNWAVLVVWECEIKKDFDNVISFIVDVLENG